MYTIDIDKESKNILLLDSSVDLNEIKRTFCKIITFDFESNRNLLTKKILHEVSDTLINFSELEILDSICLNLCQWYNENKGNEILVYEDINLGSLFRIEFHNFLIPILKKF
jgi:hypothetical protein